MATTLGELFKSITHNTVGNIISTFILAGAAALLAWMTARSAYLTGQPLYKAMFFGVSLFVLVAIGLLFFGLAINFIRGRNRTPTESAGDATLQQVPQEVQTQAILDLERKLTALQQQFDETQWLREIAGNQRKAIRDYVRTDCWIIDHSLLKEPLFIEFRFVFYSSCLFPLAINTIRGSVRFANSRLSAAAAITSDLTQDIVIGGIGWLTISQTLRRDEAVRILNQHNSFYFDQLNVGLEAVGYGVTDSKKFNSNSIDSRDLQSTYPKLEADFQKSIFRESHNISDQTSGMLINIYVRLHNPRQVESEIQKIRITTQVDGKDYVAYAERNQISEHRIVNDQGVEEFQGIPLKNLAPPNGDLLQLESKQSREGWFQFIVLGDIFGPLRGQSRPDKIGATLSLIDRFGEEHSRPCILTYTEFSGLSGSTAQR